MNVEMGNDIWSNRERELEDILDTAQWDMGHIRKGKGKRGKGKCRDGSVDEELPVQVLHPEFRSPDPVKCWMG